MRLVAKLRREENFDIVQAYSHYAEGTGSVLAPRPKDHSDFDPHQLRYFRSLRTASRDHLCNQCSSFRSPGEVAGLMGFPESFSFPSSVSRRQQYKLLGNSVSVRVVAALAAQLLRDL